ncbi:MAG: hypothetical protein WBG11_05000, partial [Methylocella sp.]
LERLREVYRAIGGEAFMLILDGQTDSVSAALVRKFDKDNSDIKTAPPDWLRRRIAELASGAAEPARKLLKIPKKGPAKKPLKTPKKESAGTRPPLTSEQKDIAAGLKKAINLEKVRGLWRETGEANFTLILASLTEKQTLALATKLDKDNPDIKTAPAEQLRERIAGLAKGAAEPIFRNILESEALEAALARTPKAKKPPRPPRLTGKRRRSP